MSEWDDFMKKYGGGSNSQTESADGQSSGQGNGGVTASDWDAFMARYGQGAQAQAQPKQQVQPQQNAAAAQPAAPVTIASVRQPEQASVMHPGEAAQYMPKQIQNGIDFAEKYAVQPAHVRDNKAPVLKAADNVNSVKEELSALQQEVVAAETKILDLVRNNTIVGEDNKRVFTDQAAKDAYDAAYKECEAAMRKHAVAARRLTDAAAVFDFQYNKHVQAYNEAAQARAQAEYEKTDYYKYKTMYDAGQLEPDYINNLKASAEQEVEKWNNELDTLFSYAEDDRPADYSERLGQAYTNIEAALSSLEKANDLAIVGPEWRNYFAVESKRGAQDWDEKVAAGREIYEEATEKRTEDYQNSGVIMQGLAGFSDDPFDYYNAITDIKDDLDDRFPASNQYVKTLSEEDRDMYFYLLGNGEQEVALDFVDAAMRGIRKERLESVSEWAGTNVGTRLLAYIASGFMTLGASLDLARETGKYGYHISDVKHALDEGIAQGLTEKGLFNQGWLAGTIDEDIPVFGGKNLGTVAQLGASMRDSVIAALISAGAGSESAGALMLASDAGYMAYRNSLDNGAPEKDAFLYGIAAGVAEYVFEKVSIGELLKKPSASWWKEALKQGGVEASEETLTTLANTLSQRVILKDYSDYNIAWRKYMTEGYSEGEAKQKAISDAFYGVMDDAIGGFISGGVMQGGRVGINAIHNAYTDHQKAKIRAANGGILYFDREQRLNREALDAQMAEYNKLYGNGDADVLAKMGLAEDQIKKALKDYEEIKQDYEKCKEMSVDTETSDAANSTPDIGVDRRIFTEDTAAEDARSVVEAHRQLEQDGRLQDPNVAQELLQAAEAATSIVNNAEARGRLMPQEAYDSELALQQVIESTKAVLAQNNTPAQTTAPVQNIKIGGMDNGRTEGVTDGTQRNEGVGADQQGAAVQRSAEKATERGRNASLEVRRAVNAGEYDRASAKSLGIKGGSERESMQLLRESVVERIDALRTIRDEAAKDGVKAVFFTGDCEVYNKHANKTERIEGVYVPDSNTVYVKADKVGRSPETIYRHEMMHNMIHDNPGMLDYALQLLGEQYTPEELDRLVDQYCEAYHGIYGTITEDMSADEQRDVFMKYVEEICADAYAGIRRGSINTVKAEQAMAVFRSDRTDSGRQTAAATDRTNGPGEQRYSLSPDTDIEEENIKNGTDALNWLIEQAKESDDPESLIRRNAMYRSDIGQIDFVWGKPGKGEKLRSGYGISHIIARHGETTAQKAVEVLAKGVEYDKQRNDNTNPSDYRLRLYYDGYTAVLVKDENSHWLLTAWENDVKTAVSAAGEVYGSSGATAVTPTHTRRNGVNTAVSDNSIPDERRKSNPSDKKSTDAAYLSIAEKYRDGTASEAETAALQRMVDQAAKAAGYSIPAWHGTSGDEFTVFEYGHNRKQYSTGKNLGEGFYFATSKEYAENYADTSNGNARTIQSVLKIDHPYVQYGTEFDYADLAKLSKEAGYEVTKKNVSEYLQSKEYDGVINKEYDGKDRAYVVYDPEQVKSAEPVTYDDDGNIIPLSERFRTDRTGEDEWKNNDIRYSVEDDAAEYDEDYRRAVQKDAAEDEKNYEAQGFTRIRERAQEASLQQLRQMIKKSEEDLRTYQHLKRKGRLTATDMEEMQITKETLRIQEEELKKKNNQERKQREKRKEEEAKQQQPQIAKKELKAEIAEKFRVAQESRKLINDIVEEAANKIIRQGYLTNEDRAILFNALLQTGVVNIEAEGYYGEIRSYLQSGRIYVPESVREEFGDDWNDFRLRAMGNHIYLTNNELDRGIDDWNADLANMFPGGFEEGATDMKEALEQIVALAEEGNAENITIAEMMERNRDNYGWSVESQMEQLEEQFDAALRKFAETAKLEVRIKQTRATDVLRERKRHREMLEEARERKRLSLFREQTMRKIKALYKIKNKLSPEFKAKYKDALRDVDTMARSFTERGIEDTIYMAGKYKEAKNAPNFIPNEYVEKKLDRLYEIQLNNMSVTDLVELSNLVSGILDAVKTSNKMRSEAFETNRKETATGAAEEIRKSVGSKDGTLHKFNLEHLSARRFLEMLGGFMPKGFMEKLAQALEDGGTNKIRYLMEGFRIFTEFTSNKENQAWLKKASGKNAEWIEVEIPNLKEAKSDLSEVPTEKIYITPMMRVAFYLHGKNYANMQHIYGDGITIPDRTYYVKGDMKNAYGKGRTLVMSPEIVKKITKDMTAQERQFAKLLQDYYDKYSKEKINEVSMKAYGYERATVENYYPIKTNNDFLATLPENIKKDASIENTGYMKERIQGAKNPILLFDASTSLADHLEEMSSYYGYVVPIRDINAVLSYTFINEKGTKEESVIGIIKKKWGASAETYINRLLEDLQSKNAQNDLLGAIMAGIRSRLAGSSLMFNPAVALSQMASYPGAMQTLGARALAEGLRLWERTDLKLIEKYSPLLWYRMQGNSTIELGDYNKGKTLEQKLPGLLGWIQKFDTFTVRRLWAAAEHYVSNNTDLKPGSEAEIAAGTDEYYQKVAEMFNRAVYDTQPNYSTMQRPQILRSHNELVKYLTMFKTVPLQYYNMAFEATGRLTNAIRRGDKAEIKEAAGYFARTTVGLISANAIYVAMKALFKVLRFKDKDYRDEEGELTVGSFMGQLGLDFLDTSAGSLIGGAELLDVIERIAAAVGGEKQRYNGIDINAISFVADVVQDIMDLGSAIGSLDGKDLADAIRGIVKEGVMGTLGLPAQNAETYLLALVKWISPETAERYNNLFSDRSKSTLSEEHGRYLEAAISVYMDNRAELSDEVKQELQRLWEAGQKNAIPSAVPSSVTVGGESVALTSDQKAQFRKDWSRIVSENLEAMIGSEYYQSADETTQGKLIDRLYRYASEVAKENLGIDYTAENWAASAETDGLPEYLTYYTLRSMLDRDGSEMQNTAAVAAVMDYVIGGISEDDSAEIARLYMVGAEGLIPQTAPTSIEFKDENGTQRVAELDAEQRAKYAEAYRNAIGNQLGVLMSSPEYADADDKGRTALIGKVFDFAAGVAKAEVAEGYTPDKWILNGFEDMEDGIQLADYIVYHTGYTRLNGKNEDGESESGLKDRRTLDLIDGNDWTDDQKISVYLDNCSNAAAGKVKAMDAAGFSWKQIKTVLTADKQEIAVLQANVSDSAKLKVLEIYCNEKQMAKYQVGYQFGVSFKDYAEVMQNANTDGKGSITQDEATDYIKSMALSAQDSAYLWQMVTDGKNGKKNPFSPTWGAEFYYEMHKND